MSSNHFPSQMSGVPPLRPQTLRCGVRLPKLGGAGGSSRSSPEGEELRVGCTFANRHHGTQRTGAGEASTVLRPCWRVSELRNGRLRAVAIGGSKIQDAFLPSSAISRSDSASSPGSGPRQRRHAHGVSGISGRYGIARAGIPPVAGTRARRPTAIPGHGSAGLTRITGPCFCTRPAMHLATGATAS